MGYAACNSAALTTGTGLAVGALADVEVRRESDGAVATVYSDEAGTAIIAQPGFQADASGRFVFYAPGVQRGYSVKVTKAGGGETWTLHNVAIGTAAQLDANGFMNGVDQERAKRRARHFAALNYL